MESESKIKFEPITYMVEVDGMRYSYALHSTKKHRIIFPSQILNILEYCLFKKVKGGFRDSLNQTTFPHSVTKMNDGNPVADEAWPEKAAFLEAVDKMLGEYYKNIIG